jgi:hypothetical protein
MDIAIPVLSKALPNARKLAAILKQFGPLDSRHKITVFTTVTVLNEVQRIFDGIRDVTFKATLPTLYREPPRSLNETFDIVARAMVGNHWFYMSTDTRPVVSNWADVLDQEYRASGKRYLGFQVNLTRRFRDASGVERVDVGDPYILEAAVYPANLTKLERNSARNHGSHHEVFRRHEMVKHTATTDHIGNANWNDNYVCVSPNEVVVTRISPDWGIVTQSAPLELPIEAEPEIEKQEAPMLSVDDSQNEVTLDNPKRGRGRPRKVPVTP